MMKTNSSKRDFGHDDSKMYEDQKKMDIVTLTPEKDETLNFRILVISGKESWNMEKVGVNFWSGVQVSQFSMTLLRLKRDLGSSYGS